MLFNSFSFAVFLPIVFALFWLVPKRFQWLVLLIASYWFYMSWNVKYVVLILFTTVVSYSTARLLELCNEIKQRKRILLLALTACLGVLFLFKYFNFFSATVFSILQLFSVSADPFFLKVMLPVGISFYTFQTLSYVIDVYRGTVAAEHHFGKYAAFISFFPQLVAGPIERTAHLLPQILAPHTFDYDQAVRGMRLMLWGFFKKMVIADNLAIYVDQVFNAPSCFPGLASVVAICFFTIQIYCDFSGYSDIAVGCARLFGIELTHNFRSPYFSCSIREFWSRWHISLSTWFRDYVYIPLGGNRVSPARHRWNLLVTFLISGLWHGANWTFVFWGGLHGLAQIAETFLPRRKSSSRVGLLFQNLLTFAFVIFAWTFFRAQTLHDAFFLLAHLFSGISDPIQYIKKGYISLNLATAPFSYICIQMLLLTAYDLISLRQDIPSALSRLKKPIRWALYAILLVLIALWTPVTSGNEFLYFQF